MFTSYHFKPKDDDDDEDFQFIHEYNLSTPYDISTRTYAGNDERCELGSGSTGHADNSAHDLEFSNDGMKLFTSDKIFPDCSILNLSIIPWPPPKSKPSAWPELLVNPNLK